VPDDVDRVSRALEQHLRDFFAPREVHELTVPARARSRLPELQLFHVVPEGREPWLVASVGAWTVTADTGHGYEFFILGAENEPQLAEIVMIAAYYHANPEDASYRLGEGHRVPIGEPYLRGTCDHLLLSKPYPYGPGLEFCHIRDDLHVQFLWLLPITRAEREFALERDVEALEQRFDDAAIDYLDPNRESVV
jgi:Suppressor of fused protein (SUFU)